MRFPKGIIVGPPVLLTDIHKFGRSQTAIGLPGHGGEKYLPILAVGDGFDDTIEKWRADEAAMAEKQNQADRGAREKRLAEERAKEPHGPARVLSRPQIMAIRADAKLMDAAKSAPPMNEVCTRAYMAHDAKFFLDQRLDSQDLVSVLHSVGSVVKPYSEIREIIGTVSTIGVNALARGERPKRKHVAIKFGVAYWKQLSHLAQGTKPFLIYCGAADANVYAWLDCKSWTDKQLTQFATKVYLHGGEVIESAPVPDALVARLSGTLFTTLHAAGLLKNKHSETLPRNYVLLWREPGEQSLPTPPKRGRSV